LPVGAATISPTLDPALIAPCGMNCALCAGYLPDRNDLRGKGVKIISFAGCRSRNKKYGFLKKKCGILSKGELTFCHECNSFPCERLKTIDKRYRARYRMSMIENLEFIRENGLDRFIEDQKKKWKCQRCGELISCHNGLCFKCDFENLRSRKQKYRWDEFLAPK